jgi:hypothetical protein
MLEGREIQAIRSLMTCLRLDVYSDLAPVTGMPERLVTKLLSILLPVSDLPGEKTYNIGFNRLDE